MTRRSFLKGFGVFVLAILLATCSDGGGSKGGGGGYIPPDVDSNPSLTVPTSPSDIPNFASSKGYTPMEQEEIEELWEEITSMLEELIDDLNEAFEEFVGTHFSVSSSALRAYAAYNNSAFGRTVLGRAIVSDSFDIKLSEASPAFDGFKINGFVKGTLSYNDAEDFFPITINGSSEFRVEMSEGFIEGLIDEEGDWDIFGVIAGRATVNNIKVTSEDEISGSLSGSINCALNIAVDGKWLKLIVNITLTSNLGNETVTASFDMKAYGDGSSPLISESIKITANPSGVTVN